MNMKKVDIKVCEKNKDIINAILVIYQQKYKTRCIDYNDIIKSVIELDTMYRGVVPIKMMKGIHYTIDVNGQRFPHKYLKKGTPMSTHFEIEHNGKDWVLTYLYREECKNKVVREVFIPYEAEKRIKDNAVKKFETGGWK